MINSLIIYFGVSFIKLKHEVFSQEDKVLTEIVQWLREIMKYFGTKRHFLYQPESMKTILKAAGKVFNLTIKKTFTHNEQVDFYMKI